MTTMTLTPATRVQTRLRITARGRRVLAALIALPIAIGIAAAALSGGSATASAEASGGVSFETVTVVPGDTLWSIATTIAPEADPRDVIDEIRRLNLLQSGALSVGQELALPVAYTK